MDLSNQVEAFALPFIEVKKTVGLAVGVVYEGQNHAFCYGGLEKDGSAAPDERTLFEIGSITKVFTTTLLADMHLKGEVDLDDPASKFLPSSVVLRSRRGVDVTLRHLATHTSGLPRIPSNLGMKNLRSDNPYAKYKVEDMYAYLSKPRLTTAPGSTYSYSNLGMGLLGHILGLAAEMDYGELVIERICRPLGMNDTAITLSDDQLSRLAPGHARRKQVSNWDIPTLAGCGAFRSTIHDMLTFLNANIHPESTPLQVAIELAQTIQTREKSPRHLSWRAALPDRFRLFVCIILMPYEVSLIVQGQVLLATVVFVLVAVNFAVPLMLKFLPQPDMGLGWHVKPLDDGDGRVFWHNGGTGGYRSYTGFAEGRDVGVVLLSNSTVPPDPTGLRLLNSLATSIEEGKSEET